MTYTPIPVAYSPLPAQVSAQTTVDLFVASSTIVHDDQPNKVENSAGQCLFYRFEGRRGMFYARDDRTRADRVAQIQWQDGLEGDSSLPQDPAATSPFQPGLILDLEDIVPFCEVDLQMLKGGPANSDFDPLHEIAEVLTTAIASVGGKDLANDTELWLDDAAYLLCRKGLMDECRYAQLLATGVIRQPSSLHLARRQIVLMIGAFVRFVKRCWTNMYSLIFTLATMVPFRIAALTVLVPLLTALIAPLAVLACVLTLVLTLFGVVVEIVAQVLIVSASGAVCLLQACGCWPLREESEDV
ncbi:hypothetical protein OF83DRAFT_1171300 [Amylostereum chailletii]|nr:hypothetical protein OF83DRAFT_1171300 [Amylostereum chailletii]